MNSVSPRRVTHSTIVNVLLCGFGLVLLLLLAAAGLALQSGRAIQLEAEALLREQSLTARLMDEIRVEQAALNSVLFQITNASGPADTTDLARQLDAADETLRRLGVDASNTPEAGLWRDLTKTGQAFSGEARRLLSLTEVDKDGLTPLIHLHDRVVQMVSKLSEASSKRSLSAETTIHARARDLMHQSVLLLGTCIVLALIGSLLTIRTAAHLFRRMEEQAGELSRVSWQMLKGQEDAARRFSHELHDELGQGLTALKANLAVLTPENLRERRADALLVADDCIRNVRELSQLLRPVILDDFGLSASLQWLAERFSERTGIELDCQPEFRGRLNEEVETHLFRVAQEALTNVARHSGATRVSIALQKEEDRLTLTICDNGRGLTQPRERSAAPGLGLIGMRARARHAGGDFSVVSRNGSGVTIRVWVPATLHAEQENAHFAGR